MIEVSHDRHFYEIGFIKLYVTLFLSGFLAATIFPAQAETLLAYQIAQNPNAAVILVGVATFGNVLGSVVNWVLGRFASKTIDIQAQDIFAGKRPVDDLAGWGYESKANWGTLAIKNGRKVIPSEQGRYHDYYEAFAEAVKTGGAPPVTAVVGARTLAVLDAARQSALEGRSITLEGN